MTHTPGPWTVKPGSSVVVIVDGSGRRIGAVDRAKYWESYSETDFADARLIAAAPTMLEALRFIADRENLMFAECSDAEEIIAVARAALARATSPTA